MVGGVSPGAVGRDARQTEVGAFRHAEVVPGAGMSELQYADDSEVISKVETRVVKEEQAVLDIIPPEQAASVTRSRVVRATSRRANDLDGTTWQRYSISVWSDIKKTQQEINLRHPAIFPAALVSRLVQCFTTEEYMPAHPR